MATRKIFYNTYYNTHTKHYIENFLSPNKPKTDKGKFIVEIHVNSIK